MADASEERCSRCGGTTGASSSGSITQWIAVCSCVNSPSVSENESAASFKICAGCGKRVNEGRVGSLTQWVFRQDLCACARPQPVDRKADSFNAPNASGVKASPEGAVKAGFEARAIRHDQPALEVDSAKFPLERYTPLMEVGKGGSGTIYYCRDRVLDKVVAVKTLHQLSAEELLAFQNEARAHSKLTHPSIVRVRDFGATAGGVPYMSMDYVNGVSLLQLIAEHGTLAAADAVELFHQVCMGLAHAHAAGIFHRDIKSSNLLVFRNDQGRLSASIIDFGVAVSKGQAEKGGTLVGTPRYMPPDVPRGEIYDERSEIYELGCTMFEALTGDTPFTGEDPVELVRRHAEEPPPTLSSRNADGEFSDELEEIVKRCLEKEKSKRYQSMEELGAALAALRREAAPEFDDNEKPVASAARKGGYALATVLLVSGVVLVFKLGFAIFEGTEKLTEEKAVDVKDHQLFGDVMVDAATESIKPRFESRDRNGEMWTYSKGAVTNDSLVVLSKRKDIERLSLMGDSVDGRGLVFLLELPLVELDLEATHVSDMDMPLLTRFKKLEVLRLANSDVKGRKLSELNRLSRLQSLGIGGPLIDDDAMEEVAKLNSVTEIYLRNAKRVTASGIAKLSAMPELERVVIKEVPIEDEMLTALKGLRKLTALALFESRLDSQILAPIRGLKLQRLYFHNDRISDDAFELMSGLKKLKSIEFEDCFGFSDAALTRLRKSLPKCHIDVVVKKKVRPTI